MIIKFSPLRTFLCHKKSYGSKVDIFSETFFCFIANVCSLCQHSFYLYLGKKSTSMYIRSDTMKPKLFWIQIWWYQTVSSLAFLNWDSQQDRDLATSRRSNKRCQFCQSYSYTIRKVWYHQIWIQNYFGFIVSELIKPLQSLLKRSLCHVILLSQAGSPKMSLPKN